jgi:hypothetical protein
MSRACSVSYTEEDSYRRKADDKAQVSERYLAGKIGTSYLDLMHRFWRISLACREPVLLGA